MTGVYWFSSIINPNCHDPRGRCKMWKSETWLGIQWHQKWMICLRFLHVIPTVSQLQPPVVLRAGLCTTARTRVHFVSRLVMLHVRCVSKSHHENNVPATFHAARAFREACASAPLTHIYSCPHVVCVQEWQRYIMTDPRGPRPCSHPGDKLLMLMLLERFLL